MGATIKKKMFKKEGREEGLPFGVRWKSGQDLEQEGRETLKPARSRRINRKG